jgi:hypothetical protein
LLGLARSIGHPQLWIIACSALLLWFGTDWASQPGKERRAFWTGLIAAAILLFKVNIGIFVFIAIALLVSLHVMGWPRIVFSTLVILAATTLGIILYASTPANSEKCFAAAYLASLATTVGAAISQSAHRQIRAACVPWLAVGFGLCLCVGLGVTLALGTTPLALFEDLIVAPSHLARSYHYAFLDATRRSSLLMSLIGFGAALSVLCGRRLIPRSPVWLGSLKVAGGAALLFQFWFDDRLALTGSLLFLWLLIMDVPTMSGRAYFDRLLLAVLSVLCSLQLYPIAGDHVNWAALMPMTAAAVLLADGTNLMAREAQTGWLPHLGSLSARAVGALLAGIVFVSVGGNARETFGQWRREQPVNLPGAHWLRLPKADTDVLTATVSHLAQNCQTVLTLPGLYSFSIWSGVPPFERKRFNSWPFLWPEDVQNHEMRDIHQQTHGCVLVSQKAYQFYWMLGVSKANSALLAEIQRTMSPIAVVEDTTTNVFPAMGVLQLPLRITLYRPSVDVGVGR